MQSPNLTPSANGKARAFWGAGLRSWVTAISILAVAMGVLRPSWVGASPFAYIKGNEIDTTTNAIVRVLGGPGSADFTDSYGAAVSADGSRLYVSEQRAGLDEKGVLVIIDIASGNAVGSVEVGYLPGPVAVTPDNSLAFLGAFATPAGLGGGPPDLYVIDLLGETVIDVVEAAGGGFVPVVSPDGRFVYACGRYDTQTATLDPGLCAGNYGISPDGNRLFIVQQPTFQTSALLMLDFEAGSSYQLTVDIQMGPGGPPGTSIVASPDGSRVYWAISGNGNTRPSFVFVTDVADTFNTEGCPQACVEPPLTLAATIEVPDFPGGMDVTPDGSRVYLVSPINGAVTVIDTATNSIVDTIDIPVGPTTAYGRFIAPRSAGNGTPPPDTTPDPFSFPEAIGVAPETVVQSATVPITGIDAPAPVTITGGEYSINCSNSFTSMAGTISNNQTVCVRHTSAAGFSESTVTTLTIGGVSADFTSTTMAEPPPGTTPDPFSFAPVVDVLLSVPVTSEEVPITGIGAPAPVEVANGSWALSCDGPFSTAPGMLEPGESVCVQHISAAECLTTVTTTLNVGGVSATFTSTTIDDSVDSDGDGVSDCLDDFPFDPTIATPPLPGGNQLVIAIDDGALSGVAVVDPEDQPNQEGRPEDFDFPWGLASYSIVGIMAGSSVEVVLTFPSALPANAEIWKYSDADGFVPFGSAVITGSTVTLTLTDGGEGDADGEANGVIVDPVGVAVPPPPPPPPAPPGGGGGGGAMGLGWMTWLAVAGWLLARRAPTRQRRRAT